VDAKLELAENLRGQGAFDEALELYYATVELHTKVGGQDCLEVASKKGNIGLVYDRPTHDANAAFGTSVLCTLSGVHSALSAQ